MLFLRPIINLFLKDIEKRIYANKLIRSFSSKLVKNKKIIPASILIILSVVYSYFYFIGRPRYFIRSDIIVRKIGNENKSFSLESLLNTGNQGSLEDAKYLQVFLKSSQVFEALENEINFREVYKRKGLDIFAGVKNNFSRDKTYRFFKKQVSVTLDTSSGIIILRTFAYDPGTSYLISKFLIEEAENFVNDLNQSIYKKQINFVNKEVFSNYKKLEKASSQLSAFQRLNQIFDAKNEASAGILLINELQSKLAKEKIELGNLRRTFVDENSPEIAFKKSEIEAIKIQIDFERNELVAPKGKDLTKKVQKLSELENNLKFASDIYKSALNSSEQNRIDSIRKQRFIAVINKPVKPEDEYLYWRHRGFLTSLAVILVSFLLIKFLKSVSDNRD